MIDRELRLRIAEVVIPQASRVGITEPSYIVKTCKEIEKYVIGRENSSELLDSQPKRKGRKPKGDNF